MQNTGGTLIAIGALGVVGSLVYIGHNPLGFTLVCLFLSAMLIWGGMNFESFAAPARRERDEPAAVDERASLIERIRAESIEHFAGRAKEVLDKFEHGEIAEEEFLEAARALIAMNRPDQLADRRIRSLGGT